MANLSTTPVLVLNASYEAIQIVPAKRAIILLCKEVADTIQDRGRDVYPGMPFPSVVKLRKYRNIPNRVQILNRKNVYVRDRYTCQYCGQKFTPGELTLDHVLPSSKGGKSTWQNLVACCRKCNRKKADRTPEEAGMPLLSRPRPVTIHTARHLLRSLGEQENAWRKFLYFDTERHENEFA
jgi:5-methylcytosine-specific restriction endonuclease McrA